MHRILFSAPFIFIFAFLVVTIGSNFVGIFYPYSLDYYLYLTCAFTIFTLSYAITRMIRMPNFVLFTHAPLSQKRAIRFYFYFMIIGLSLNMLNLFIVSGPGFLLPSRVGYYRAFISMFGGSPAVPFLSFFNFFFFTAIPMLIISGRAVSKGKKVICAFMYLLFIYLSIARAPLFFSAMMGFYFYFINRKVNLKLVGYFLGFGALLIFGFGLLGALAGKPLSASSIFYDYLMGGSHVVDILLNNLDAYKDAPFLTFNSMQQVLVKLGVLAKMGVAPYFHTPLPTNVYTIFGVYILDYGIVGSLMLMILLGGYSGYLEQLFYREPHNNYLRLLFALNLTVLSLAIFSDYYLSSGIVWMTIILGAIFFTKKGAG
jgi:oligosaccharide repeat unit polymerase